ncbi:MAG TPA: hypothetical protein VHX14_12375 [Thermoanaerobaculia bacterium]|jgi:hypothetical protein|nr:hypothetical protein [Thermoanaerobaculia bacterium]
MLWLAATLFAAATTLHHPQPGVLFALQSNSEETTFSPDKLAIEPVAMITKVPGACAGCWKLRFDPPPRDDGRGFEARYFRPGRTYRVLDGGAEIGTVKVTKPTSLGCVSLAASVDVTSRSNWDTNLFSVLAAGSLHLPPTNPGRRVPDDDEDKALRKIAERELRTKGVSQSMIAKMEGGANLSTDLDHDGRRDLIGAFSANDGKDQRRTYNLFLIAMGDESGGFRADHVWYFTYSGDAGEDKNVVDTIDLDEDGTDEIVIRVGGYEGYEYEILKRAGNKWKSVYRGGGSGC